MLRVFSTKWVQVPPSAVAKFRGSKEMQCEAGKASLPNVATSHRAKLHSTNPIGRLDGEIKRRTEGVGIFPNETAHQASRRSHPARTKRRMGGPACALHDAGNHRARVAKRDRPLKPTELSATARNRMSALSPLLHPDSRTRRGDTTTPKSPSCGTRSRPHSQGFKC
jgi:hypothetical protein